MTLNQHFNHEDNKVLSLLVEQSQFLRNRRQRQHRPQVQQASLPSTLQACQGI